MSKTILAVLSILVLIIVAVGGFYVWKMFSAPKATLVVPPAAEDTRSTYATSTYSIKYPGNFSANSGYAYDQFGPKKLIQGVKFLIPGTMATGTNLSASDTGISVEQLPNAKKCTGDIYLTANVTARNLTENGTDYSFASSSGVAAGNFYEEEVYALATSTPCTAVRYFIHSANIGNYEPGTAQEYDRSALMSAFDKIRASLVLN